MLKCIFAGIFSVLSGFAYAQNPGNEKANSYTA